MSAPLSCKKQLSPISNKSIGACWSNHFDPLFESCITGLNYFPLTDKLGVTSLVLEWKEGWKFSFLHATVHGTQLTVFPSLHLKTLIAWSCTAKGNAAHSPDNERVRGQSHNNRLNVGSWQMGFFIQGELWGEKGLKDTEGECLIPRTVQASRWRPELLVWVWPG